MKILIYTYTKIQYSHEHTQFTQIQYTHEQAYICTKIRYTRVIRMLIYTKIYSIYSTPIFGILIRLPLTDLPVIPYIATSPGCKVCRKHADMPDLRKDF
jgi:hypothetical protein